MITIIRKHEFCAGHRLWKHEGKCAHLHGHNYVAYFHVTNDKLDHIGRVIDFTAIKHSLGTWIDKNWDHSFILFKKDKEACTAVASVQGQRIFYLENNPTLENMASYLLHKVGPKELNGTGVKLCKVVLWETQNCYAEASL